MGKLGLHTPSGTTGAPTGIPLARFRNREKSKVVRLIPAPAKHVRLRRGKHIAAPAAEELPPALRAERRIRRTKGAADDGHVACCVYCDDAMLVNGLLAVGSFKHFAPTGRGILFVRGGAAKLAACAGLRDVEVVDSDLALRTARIGVEDWSREHDGIAEHYFRKVAMWLYMFEQPPPVAGAAEWLAFSDADVLFVRPIQPLLRHARAHPFAAMVERWHNSLYAVYRQAPDVSRRELGQLFHGQIEVREMRRTRYYNTGLMLCRRDERVRSAVKDVLMASMLYPALTRHIRFPEQTLMNLAMMVRGVRCRDLLGLCVPSYHDEKQGWPPPVVRHYLGDPVNRQPAALWSRHGVMVEQALEAVGTSVGELKERGLWPEFSAAAATGTMTTGYPGNAEC